MHARGGTCSSEMLARSAWHLEQCGHGVTVTSRYLSALGLLKVLKLRGTSLAGFLRKKNQLKRKTSFFFQSL